MNLVHSSLPRKCSCQKCVLLVVIVDSKLVSHVDGFTSTCWPTEQNVHVILYVQVQKIIVTDTIICWNDQVVVTDILRNDKGRDRLGPVLPHQFLHGVEHIENVNFFREFCAVNYRVKLIIWVYFTLSYDIWTSVN